MPIGVPKVAYRTPGALSADWVDLYNRLYRERILFLGQQVDEEIANQMIGIMLYLDSEDNSKPISMYINSPGGSVTAGFAMFDTMRHVKSDISTINVGLAASMGSLLLAGGQKGKRLALPHSRTMIHQPAAGGIQGQASDIKVEAEMILAIRERVVNYYSLLCGQPKERVVMDLDRDNFLSADEALEYGLIDRVIEYN
jgi:ATP-dependent Clp endopeptidase proteolytic subunit ClpP